MVAHDKGQVLLVQFAQHILSIDAHQTIGACTQPDLCRTLDGADTVAGVDTLYQSRCVVTVGRGVVEDNIHAGLVERNGVERRQDTHILHLGGSGVAVAVAIHREVVHDIDIDRAHAGSTPFGVLRHIEVLVYSIGSRSHRLVEEVLFGDTTPQLLGVFGNTRRVDIGFAVAGGDTDTLVLQHAAEAAHGMPLEVGEIDQEIVVRQMFAHKVVANMQRVAHGDTHLAELVHQVAGGNSRPTMVDKDLLMVFDSITLAPIGGVALDNSALHLIHQGLDELRIEVVVSARLARRDLHRHTPLGRNTQRLEDTHQRGGGNLLGHIHDCRVGNRRRRGGVLTLAAARQQQSGYA